ncbi:hypothetical protein [Undibacterium sp.]|jgi:hypothetical protein|uniref:hypothetical protein n=1 Tax=Undibacterium sp. TaxID=1914977 RepID=UPI002C088CD7|nr:hypothetical protein [Undibacterium sp.]HTD05789.1 hypothetical protein [Undibacterium sp.]
MDKVAMMKAKIVGKLLIVGLACFSQLGAHAEERAARQYAALSLVGDSITVVFETMVTGSHLGRNGQQKIDIANTSLDVAALSAADSVISKLQPGAKTQMLISNDAGLYRMQGALFSDTSDAGIVLDGLKLALKNTPSVTHLVLVTKHRGDARLKLRDVVLGSGKLEGLGFYIDDRAGVRHIDTGDTGVGLIAPYAYMTVRLIDTRNWAVIREKSLDSSAIFSNTGNVAEGVNTWGALTAEQKATALKALIKETVQKTAEDILADKPA